LASVSGVLVLAGGLLLYGNLLAFRAVRAPWVVVVNLALAAALVAGTRAAGLSWDALGLGPGRLLPGLAWGVVVAAVAAAGAAIVLVTPARRWFRDVRLVETAPAGLAFHLLIRIPFGTALFEEVAFRGALLAAWTEAAGTTAAVAGSSIAFGLWHVGATLDLLRANRPDGGRAARTAGVASGLALTALGGAGFCLLRLASDSLIAPVVAHAGINVAGFVAARAASPA
jgi:uncharacterized protein